MNLNKLISIGRVSLFRSFHDHLACGRQPAKPEASQKRMIGDKTGCLFRQQLPASFQSRESVFHCCWTGEARRSKQLAALSAGGTSPNIMLDNTLDNIMLDSTLDAGLLESFSFSAELLHTCSSCCLAEDQRLLSQLPTG